MILKGKHIFILGATKFDGPDQSTSFNIAKELSKTISTRRTVNWYRRVKSTFPHFQMALLQT